MLEEGHDMGRRAQQIDSFIIGMLGWLPVLALLALVVGSVAIVLMAVT